MSKRTVDDTLVPRTKPITLVNSLARPPLDQNMSILQAVTNRQYAGRLPDLQLHGFCERYRYGYTTTTPAIFNKPGQILRGITIKPKVYSICEEITLPHKFFKDDDDVIIDFIDE